MTQHELDKTRRIIELVTRTLEDVAEDLARGNTWGSRIRNSDEVVEAIDEVVLELKQILDHVLPRTVL